MRISDWSSDVCSSDLLPDLMTRLHSPTKSSSLGIGGVLLASMIYGVWQNGWLSTHELLITLFVFLTAPITPNRPENQTPDLRSLMPTPLPVFGWKKKKTSL